MRYLKDIKSGEQVVEHFLCKQKQTLKSRNGKNYMSLKLQDKTGTLNAKIWDLTNDIKSFEELDFVKIDATAAVYQNEIQLTVRKLRKSEEGEYDPSDYIPVSKQDLNELTEKCVKYIKSVKNTHLKQLLENIFINNDEIKCLFSSHSAAKTIHHSYLGGLIEHTVSVVEICDFLSSKYDYVNRDLLIASAFLHDIGKIKELSAFPVNDYTDEGQLIGHLVIGVEIIDSESKKIPGMPTDILNLLKHSILAHHGEYEFGSPVLPKTVEALILHYADNIDAKTKIFEEMICEDQTQGNWLGYHKMLSRNIRKSGF